MTPLTIAAIRKGTMTVGALGALALGGSALADAATTGSTGSTSSTTAPPAGARGHDRGGRDATTPGGHQGADGKTERH